MSFVFNSPPSPPSPSSFFLPKLTLDPNIIPILPQRSRYVFPPQPFPLEQPAT